jgi:hypothetical protein
MSGRVLYLTDKFGVSQGYMPAFTKMVHKCGIPRGRIVIASIYGLVDKPLKKKANENTWKFDPEKKDEIHAAFVQRVRSIRPTLIVISCPALLGIFSGWDTRAATIDKMRGGVYEYDFDGTKIPVIIVMPITAIHRNIDIRIIENDDGEEDKQSPYQVPDGEQILIWDWQKVGRFFQGKQRQLPPFRYSVCRTIDDCVAARSYLESCILVSVDIETGNYPPGITCVGYTGILESGACHSFVIPFFDPRQSDGCYWRSEDDHALAAAVVRDINDSPVIKTMHNGSYDASYFARDLLGIRNWFYDSMVLWWSLYMELPKKLSFVTSILCDNYQFWKDDIKGDEEESVDDNLERYWRYNALDTYWTAFDTCYLAVLLQKNKAMQFNYRDAMLRVFSGLAMSMRGMAVDWKRRDWHRENLEREMEQATQEFRFIIDEPEFNINSPAQKCSLLYDLFGLKERNRKGRYVDPSKPRTGLNAPSAGKIPLKLAKSEHPLFKHILDKLEEALQPRVQLSNIFGYKQEDGTVKGGFFMPTGRLRTSFSAVGTETTRFASKKSSFWDGGNLQNIKGKYRDWIRADEGKILLDIDYSQSDDVFMAYESQDPDKIEVVESGQDAHAVNGELFFGTSYDRIVEGKRNRDPLIVHEDYGIRQLSKKIVHGTNFQMAAMTLYVTMGREAVVETARLMGYPNPDAMNQEQLVQICGKVMGVYRRKYKRLNKKEYYAEIANELKTKRALTNCFGITRNFLGKPDDNGTQREATAFIAQSATGCNMNRVMYELDWGYIPDEYRDGPNPHKREKPLMMNWETHGVAFHLQVHDNFVSQLNTRHPRWKEAAANLLTVMNRPVIIHGRLVSIRAEAEVGLHWGKNMTPWDGKDVHDLDRISVSLLTQERMVN